MNNAAVNDRLDLAISRLLAGKQEDAAADADLQGWLSVAEQLALLPSPDFKDRLALDLEVKAAARRTDSRSLQAAAEMLPTLFGGGIARSPISRANLAASLVVHAVALSVILSSTYFVAERRGLVPENMTDLVIREIYPLPPDAESSRGGGGGGDRSKLDASHGALPKLASEQITPPAVVVKNETARLEVAPAIIVPTNIQPQRMAEIGDPTALPMIPSNGTGSKGGIGAGERGGIGTGDGPGLGPGKNGGYGDGIYTVGGDITPPRQIYSPEPDYSDEARKVKHQGAVTLWMIVGADGRPHNIRVQRSLGMGLDEKAVEAVKTWRFEPAKKSGQPVNVQVNVQVYFRLY